MIAQHGHANSEWGTPDRVLDLTRELFHGQIDFDPCSSDYFNRRVQAQRFLTHEGTWSPSWPDDIDGMLVNPPGNPPHRLNMPQAFWAAVSYAKARGKFRHAVWIAFTLEHLRHCQNPIANLVDFPICVPRERLKFVRPDGSIGTSPAHANAIVYVPGRVDERERFRNLFQELGAVRL